MKLNFHAQNQAMGFDFPTPPPEGILIISITNLLPLSLALWNNEGRELEPNALQMLRVLHSIDEITAHYFGNVRVRKIRTDHRAD
jgi:hypothetical protein